MGRSLRAVNLYSEDSEALCSVITSTLSDFTQCVCVEIELKMDGQGYKTV